MMVVRSLLRKQENFSNSENCLSQEKGRQKIGVYFNYILKRPD